MVLEMKKPVGSGVAEGGLTTASVKNPEGLEEMGSWGRETSRRQRFSLGLWNQPQRIRWRAGRGPLPPGRGSFGAEKGRVMDWRKGCHVEMTPQLLPPQVSQRSHTALNRAQQPLEGACSIFLPLQARRRPV